MPRSWKPDGSWDPNDWEPPRCSHGSIILGCPEDDCPDQDAYLAEHFHQLDLWDEQMANNAREILGAPPVVTTAG